MNNLTVWFYKYILQYRYSTVWYRLRDDLTDKEKVEVIKSL